MKKVLFAFSVILLIVQCSTYNVKKEISDSSAIKSFQKTGIVFRIPSTNEIQHAQMEKNLDAWLSSCVKNKEVVILRDVDDPVDVVESDLDRFYQLSSKNSFMKYKTVGVITLYLRNNEESIKKILSDNQLDSLLIYEIDAGYSETMQFINFNSSVVIIDSQLRICFLDYQNKSFDIVEWDPDIIKKHLMDKMNDRLLQLLADYNFIKM